MTNNKSSQERTELHRTIWSIANDLRGSVDGWDFKQYVLGMLFYRYISENLTNYINQGEREAGNSDFDYAKLSDDEAELARQDLVSAKGFFILPSELFENIKRRANLDDNLNITLEKVFGNIEKSTIGFPNEDNFKGLFSNVNINDSDKLGETVSEKNKKLIALINGVGQMDIGEYSSNSIDTFGDAYEFLMGMYASDAGKSGGEYFTPQGVSELLVNLVISDRNEVNKVYDPACGSGSLLLKFAKFLGKENVRNGFYGQEKNSTTHSLCRMNMYLHDIGYDKFFIGKGDTLINPLYEEFAPFDAIVSNPPYSIKWDGDNNPLLINDYRFSPAGILAPKSKSDMAFIMHCLSWLSNDGTAAIVCYPGVFYRGGVEQKIRKYLVDNNYIDCIIQLPEKLFFGTPIGTCILVLKKSKVDNQILFIDSQNNFTKASKNNLMLFDNIQEILTIYKERSTKQNSKLVNIHEIIKFEYDLSVSNYVNTNDITHELDINVINDRIYETIKQSQENRDDLETQFNLIKNLESKISTTKKVALSDFFNYSRGKRLKKTDRIEGIIPFVTAGYKNEGIAENISNEVERFNDSITIDMFGNCFWRPYVFSCDDNIIVLNSSLLSKENAFFFLSAIKRSMGNFHYNNQYRLEDLKRHNIEVPTIGGDYDFEVIKSISFILDNIENLIKELDSELMAEKELRYKQLKFYQKMLLNKSEVINESI